MSGRSGRKPFGVCGSLLFLCSTVGNVSASSNVESDRALLDRRQSMCALGAALDPALAGDANWRWNLGDLECVLGAGSGCPVDIQKVESLSGAN